MGFAINYRLLAEYLKRCAPSVRFLLTFLIIGIPIGVWFIAFYSPMRAAIIWYKGQSVVLKAKMNKLSRVVKTSQGLSHKIEQLEGMLSRNNILMHNEHLVLEKVVSCFKKYSLVLESYRAIKKEKYGSLCSTSYKIMMHGSYENIFRCLQSIERLYASVTDMRCELRKAEKGCVGFLTIVVLTRQDENAVHSAPIREKP